MPISESARAFRKSERHPGNAGIIRHLGHADLTDRVGNGLALRDQNVNLPQLRDNLFRLVSLSSA